MVSNIKTEIIYYCGPTDFEFEFNLNGSCHMRLLTSVANDSTSLLKALQRSITRSKVILIIGNIKGENGIISLVSKSIGYTEEKLDTATYNAKDAEDAIIVNGAVPLITDNGDFGGCIIESGPQSMIFLTEDKKIRKDIMNQLVHSYINELSRYPSPAPVKPEEAPSEEASEEIADITEEVTANPEEVICEEPTEEAVQEETAEETELNEPEEEIEEEIDKTIEEAPEAVIPPVSKNDPYNIDNIIKSEPVITEDAPEPTSYEDDDYDEEDEKKRLKANKSLDIVTLVISILLLIVLAFVVYSFIYMPSANGISIEENLKDVFSFLNL